jgi:hypothetical protein
MKHISMMFAIVLVASMASVGMAADTAPGALLDSYTFKANLSGAKIPPTVTRATGEAAFHLLRPSTSGGAGGLGTGGTVLPGDNTGMAGPDQGFGKERGDDSYAGVDRSDEFGSIPGAAPGGPPLAGDVLRYSVSVNNIKDVTAAHLHMGKGTSAEGPVIAALFLGPKKGGQFSGTLAQGTIMDKDLLGPLSGKTVTDLVALINSGEVYVNVHTTRNPQGEISGQVKEVS